MAGTTFSKGVDNLVELTKAASNLQDRDHDLRMGIRRLMHHELDLVVKSIVDAETDHLAKSLQQLTYVLPELGDWHELAGVIAEVFKKLESRKITTSEVPPEMPSPDNVLSRINEVSSTPQASASSSSELFPTSVMNAIDNIKRLAIASKDSVLEHEIAIGKLIDRHVSGLKEALLPSQRSSNEKTIALIELCLDLDKTLRSCDVESRELYNVIQDLIRNG
ncbi:MAG: hypothetical protein LQ348_005070 [Seirophora lacunosa]|nr:MAG: hypothetical protein LQ344_003557 [Seirophora lacunosa]KAI4181126.1 MAG: hypothetical protein LQ348_005070 [Seirophora lacunosa]